MAAHPDRRRAEDAASQFAADYRPLPGIRDEMMDETGRPRPHWQPLLSMLADLGPDEIARRFGAADRYLRDSGVFYRVHEDTGDSERPWPLSHVPLVIEADEWRSLKAGLVQRAQLLEAVLADVYGPAHLVRDGRLPAALVAGNPEFLRPLAGVEPPGGAHLRFYAVDVGRGADGRWWVLADRAQAPSGAGYAVENRLALSRSMPDIYRTARVERLASFFQAFQAELSSFSRQDGGRVCLLTPGPLTETYFEHAYLARYLGLLLVEGEDLTVRDDGVFIRTVSGLRRAEVLLRRLDADFSDPLELNAASRLGVAGLVQAVRDRQVVVVNSLGAGFIEARAMMAFLPALAPPLLGAELAVPNVATWWLGRADLRDAVLPNLDAMVVAPAFGGGEGGWLGDGVVGAELDQRRRDDLTQAIAERGVDYVAQEAVGLSTMPVWRDGVLQPRPFALRLFLARVGDGWQVMPGGFVRVAESADARAVSLQRGGATADAWVLADGPVGDTTLLPTAEHMTVQRASGLLPSRAADNLFWLGRYAERLEAVLRVLRALIGRMAEDESAPLIASVTAQLLAWGAVAEGAHPMSAAAIMRGALDGDQGRGSPQALVASARACAAVIRDRFSPDAWRALSDLAGAIGAPAGPDGAGNAGLERVEAALRIISSFSGLAHENMTQLGGWRFLELGRRIERAVLTCDIVRRFADPAGPDGSLDVLLELTDSQITYRQRYVMIAALAPAIDLTMLDPNNPRSVAYQLDRIEDHLAALPKRAETGRLSPVQQIAASIATRLRTADALTIDEGLIGEVETTLMKLSDMVAAAYLSHGERPEAGWDALA